VRPTRSATPIRVRLRGAACLALIGCVGCAIQIVTVPAREGPKPTARESARPSPDAVPPKPPPASLAEAEGHLSTGRLDEAIALLEPASRGDHANPKAARLLRDAYNRRALVRYGADRIQEAIADMTRSLDIDPSQEDIRAQLARARERWERIKALP
jgi:tetratricopeptide (TPR) repeat protein